MLWQDRLALLPHVPSHQLAWKVKEIVRSANDRALTSVEALRLGIEAEIRSRLKNVTVRSNRSETLISVPAPLPSKVVVT